MKELWLLERIKSKDMAIGNDWVSQVVLGGEDPIEFEMATHSSILSWKIPWRGEPGGLHPWGCKESCTTEQLNTHTDGND